jgi:hypothetical protein
MTESGSTSTARLTRTVGEKKPQGRAAHLSFEEKTAIRLAYLEAGGTLTYIELGRRFNVNRETVSACLKGPEFEKMRGGFESEVRATAVQRLKAAVIPAADAWVRAIEGAADQGDHKPAKDLLMHTGTIEPLDDDGRARGPMVLVLAKIDGLDVVKSDDGQVYDVDPETGDILKLPKSDHPIVMIGIPDRAVKIDVGACSQVGQSKTTP